MGNKSNIFQNLWRRKNIQYKSINIIMSGCYNNKNVKYVSPSAKAMTNDRKLTKMVQFVSIFFKKNT